MHNVSVRLASLEEWSAFQAENPWVVSEAYINKLVAEARAKGCRSPALGDAAADRLVIEGENWRETLSVDGCSSRVRAMLDWLVTEEQVYPWSKMLMLEAVTPFALKIRGKYPYAIGTEYLPEEADRQRMFPIQHCDIENPAFPDASVDFFFSNDVLEHIPDLDAGLRGIRRVLKPGGVMLSTAPFMYASQESLQKAVLEGGVLRHLSEPEYHGNPVDPEAGSLVFTIPGWDVLERCRAAGFAKAEMVFVASADRAITGAEIAGVFMLRGEAA